MLSIKSVTLENFKSYRGIHIFDFPAVPGLYYITGSNLKNPRLGPNGIGKSTILDAICWALYGRTVRGLKSADVVTWGEKSCSVTVKMAIDDSHVTIYRTQNPNLLQVDGVTVDQVAVDKLLRVSFDSFNHSVILPRDSFFELKPAAKLDLFSQIMSLTFWLEKSQEAQAAANNLEISLGRLDQKIINAKNFVAAAKADVKILATKEESFIAEKDRICAEIRDEMEATDADLSDLNKKRVKLGKVKLKLDEERLDAEDNLNRISAIVRKHSVRNEEFLAKKAALKAEITLREGILEELEGLIGKCPVCFQTVSPAHKKEHARKLRGELDDLAVDIKDVDQELLAASRFLQKTANNESNIVDIIRSIDVDITQTMVALSGIEANEAALKKRRASLSQDLKKESTRANPYSDMIAERHLEIAEHTLKGEELAKELADNEETFEATKFWIAGFKRLRLFVIESTLRLLEVEVNNSLNSLGLVGWQVEFDIERENKSGGITKGFTTLIRNTENPEPIKWECWSGGETQRLQLAADLGLANLIMTQAGLQSAVEFIDEPSNRLSEEGVLDLMDTLAQRAEREGKQIFVIDHSIIKYGAFAGVIEIEMTESGSEIKRAP